LLDPDKILSSVTSKDSDLEEFVDDEQNHDAKINLNHQSNKLTAEELLSVHISHYDFQRLELYSRNMVDHHMILDLIPILSRLIFTGRISSLRLSHLQLAVLLAIGLQHRDVDSICTELDLPANQVLAFFNKTIRRITSILRNILESQIKKEFPSRLSLLDMKNRVSGFIPTSERLSNDQVRDERAFNEKLAAQKNFVISLPKQENSNLIEEAADKPIKKKKKNKNSWKPKRDRDSNGNDQNLSKKERII
jgi:N-acetyltransferase 10